MLFIGLELPHAAREYVYMYVSVSLGYVYGIRDCEREKTLGTIDLIERRISSTLLALLFFSM